MFGSYGDEDAIQEDAKRGRLMLVGVIAAVVIAALVLFLL